MSRKVTVTPDDSLSTPTSASLFSSFVEYSNPSDANLDTSQSHFHDTLVPSQESQDHERCEAQNDDLITIDNATTNSSDESSIDFSDYTINSPSIPPD